MTEISKAKLSELTDEILKLNEDIVIVAICEENGKLAFRKVRKQYEGKLKGLSKQVEIQLCQSDNDA